MANLLKSLSIVSLVALGATAASAQSVNVRVGIDDDADHIERRIDRHDYDDGVRIERRHRDVDVVGSVERRRVIVEDDNDDEIVTRRVVKRRIVEPVPVVTRRVVVRERVPVVTRKVVVREREPAPLVSRRVVID
jgi:hypothetical protein